jgi:XTP/dITP diphosphohydrolase
MAASKISAKAAKAGFEWEDVDGVWDKFHEELDEFHQAIAHEPKENQQAELGDLLFTLVNIARWHGLDPSEALQSTNRRFISRFQLVEAVADKPVQDCSPDELDDLWRQAKAQLAQPDAAAEG